MILPDQISKLHAAYESLSGRTYRPDFLILSRWADWIKNGYTVQDLQLVVRWLRWKIARGDRRIESFRFNNFMDRWEDDIQDARAWDRAPRARVTDRQSVMAATGRTVEVNHQTYSAEEVLNSPRFKELLDLRNNL